ncbi:MAG TPA: response regulator transcription factor [bacterium]|nr:response regulator transcription factor [bacterium]
MERTRIVLADDMAVIRQGVRAMLSAVDDVEIVGEAADGEEAVRLACELKPDAVLIDQDMPRCDGIEATRHLKQAMPDVEIIVMTDRLDEAKALEATEAGATGYILKDIPAPNLAAALRSVCNGRAFFHPEITRKLIDNLGRLIREGRTRKNVEPEGLTRRQFDILVELAKGSTYGQIASKFVVTEGTIKTHIHNILRKLGCHNRTQLVAYVLRKGLIK